MNAINLKATEIKTTAEIINFPTKQTEAKEIKVMPWVNDNYNIAIRNNKAKQYIKAKKSHEDFWYFVSGLCLFGSIFAAYLLLCLI